MSSRIAVDRRAIVGGALDLVRRRGPGALRARTLARSLRCSTQPIYSAFRSMKDLERRLLREARRHFREFLKRDHGGSSPFENIGLGYLRFAREERHLFNWLLSSGRLVVDFEAGAHSPEVQQGLDQMGQDPSLRGLQPKQMERVQRNLWIFTHGLAVLVSNRMLRADPGTARRYMNEMAEAVITWEHVRLSPTGHNR